MCITSIKLKLILLIPDSAKLCEEKDETFNQLLLHTEARYLSRGKSLQRFVDLYDSLETFLTNVNQSLIDEL